MIKRLAIAAAAAITMAVGLLAVPATASASAPTSAPVTTDDPSVQVACTYSVRKPYISSGLIWAEAPWSCNQTANQLTTVWVAIYRDGRQVKIASFPMYGSFTSTQVTAVTCITGVHTYQAVTWGRTGSGHTFTPKWSAKLTTTSGRCF